MSVPTPDDTVMEPPKAVVPVPPVRLIAPPDVLPSPEARLRSPPLPPVDDPAVKEAAPPAPSPDPTDTDTSPPEPDADDPLPRLKAPLVPAVAWPVLKDRSPLTPLVPALAVFTAIDPELVSVLTPDNTVMEDSLDVVVLN